MAEELERLRAENAWLRQEQAELRALAELQATGREARRAIHLARIVHDLAVDAGDPRDLDRVLDIFVHGVGECLGDAVVLTLTAPGSDTLRALAFHDADPDRLHVTQDLFAHMSLRVGAGVTGRVVATQEPYLRTTADPLGLVPQMAMDVQGVARNYPIHGLLCVPLVARGQILGAVTCLRFGPDRPYEPDDVRFLESIGTHAALTILNTRLHAQALDTQETLRAQTRDLAAAVDELEAFAYSVSHDVRAPLRSIEGLAQLVLDECAPELGPQPRDWLERLRRAAVHLTELVDALLVLSRVSRAPLRTSAVDLSALAAEVAAEVAARSPDHHVELRIESDLRVLADPALLRVALVNLLENAWKFTGQVAAPTVTIASETQADGVVCFLVRDNGAGFDPGHARRLFEPFERLHRAEDFPGTGIGLATVKRVVTRHGGRVSAEARPGQGATFRFTLGVPP